MLVTRNLVKDQVVSDSGTYVFDIRDKANLHALIFEVTATNGATAGLIINNMVSGIRLVKNGSEDVCVMTGNTARQIASDVGVSSMGDYYSLTAGAVQIAVFPMLFGRQLLDENYFLRTDQLDSLQLRVDYAMTIAATGFVTGTTKFSVIAIYNYDAALGPYKGYIRTRTVYEFTSAASGVTEVPLPVGTALASVHIGINAYATALSTPIGNVLYQANQGDRVFWNDAAVRLQRISRALTEIRPIIDAGAIALGCPSGACYDHGAHDKDVNFIPANTYKYLNLALTNTAAASVVIVSTRDVVT